MQLISNTEEGFRFRCLSNIVYEIVAEILLFFGLLQEWHVRSIIKSIELFPYGFVPKLNLAASRSFFVLNETIS